jgi:hypothetical protein
VAIEATRKWQSHVEYKNFTPLGRLRKKEGSRPVWATRQDPVLKNKKNFSTKRHPREHLVQRLSLGRVGDGNKPRNVKRFDPGHKFGSNKLIAH